MKVAVIGPSNIERVAGAAGVSAALIREKAAEAGRLLAAAGLELVVVPDQGVPVIAAEAYRAAHGRRLLGLIPTSGSSAKGATSRVQRNSRLCDETHTDLTWLEQHARIAELADAMICVGVSCGTICEIAWTKWMKKIPVFVLRGLNSGIPPEIEAETDVRYVKNLDEVFRALEKLR
ncbi:MAG: hypothetical protein NTX71_12620 [Candidatus Aureabacteria bacterium]|nr:hypothetical protein [Candidatus Auribacterota bacterium]